MIKSVALLLGIGIVVQFGVLYYGYETARLARDDLVESQREGCERNKLDRQDNARFQRAHTTYIKKVTGAKSVQEDVKRAARRARRVFVSTSTRLSNRAMIDCQEVYP